MDNRPIGVFDSGLGGLTVVKELKKSSPMKTLSILEIQAGYPTATAAVRPSAARRPQDINFLCSHDVKMIVAACGTVSSVLTDKDVKDVSVPLYRRAAPSSPGGGGPVGQRQNRGDRHHGDSPFRGLWQGHPGIRPEAKVVGRDCPLFVPLVENGLVAPDNEITRLTAKMYLEPFLRSILTPSFWAVPTIPLFMTLSPR